MSEIRVDSIKNQAGTGSPTFTGTIQAGGFRVSGATGGFLKADGTIDTSTYLTGGGSIGSGDLTLAVAGTGLSLSSNPVFNANASSNKTITFTLSSTSASSPNSLVSRDSSGNISANQFNGTTFSGGSFSGSNLSVTQRILSYSTLPVNNATEITSYVNTPALTDGSSAQFGIGIACLIASNNNNPAGMEFFKTRSTSISGVNALQQFDGLGGIHFSGTDGSTKKLGASLYVDAAENWTSTFQPTYWKFVNNQVTGSATAVYRETLLVGRPLTSGDTIGSGSIYLPYVGTSSQSANAVFDANNRLVRQSSSLKYKTNIEDIEDQYAYNVLKLRPVWYKSKGQADNQNWSWYGLIAEEVAEIEPRLTVWGYSDSAYDIVVDDNGTESKKLKDDAELTPEGVQYDRISILLLKVVKDQQKKIEELEAKIDSLM